MLVSSSNFPVLYSASKINLSLCTRKAKAVISMPKLNMIGAKMAVSNWSLKLSELFLDCLYVI